VQPRNVYSGNAANRWRLCGKAEGRVINKEPKARIALPQVSHLGFQSWLEVWGAASLSVVIFVLANAYQGVKGILSNGIVGTLLT
jgi:hypothetical protein